MSEALSKSTECIVENEFVLSGDDTNKLPSVGQYGDNEETIKFKSYEFSSECSPGMVRKSNQDSAYVGVFKYCSLNNTGTACIGMVADGMGGLARGEIASSIAASSINTSLISALLQHISEDGRIPTQSSTIMKILSDSIQNANKIVYDKGVSLNEKIGTTFTGVIVFDGVAYFGHVGDSRAYIVDCEKRSIEKITRDHSLVGRLVELGHITDREARVHPRRNEIYKMLGFEKDVDVDTYYRNINKNSIILLMSDGLWELVEDDDILNEVLDNSSISISAKNLLDIANKNGGYDNISIVVIKPVE